MGAVSFGVEGFGSFFGGRAHRFAQGFDEVLGGVAEVFGNERRAVEGAEIKAHHRGASGVVAFVAEDEEWFFCADIDQRAFPLHGGLAGAEADDKTLPAAAFVPFCHREIEMQVGIGERFGVVGGGDVFKEMIAVERVGEDRLKITAPFFPVFGFELFNSLMGGVDGFEGREEADLDGAVAGLCEFGSEISNVKARIFVGFEHEAFGGLVELGDAGTGKKQGDECKDDELFQNHVGAFKMMRLFLQTRCQVLRDGEMNILWPKFGSVHCMARGPNDAKFIKIAG